MRIGSLHEQSGQSRGRETLSKRGNNRLRMLFWMAGLRAVHMRENAFRDKYERYLPENPFHVDRKRKALTAVAAKLGQSGLCRNQTRV